MAWGCLRLWGVAAGPRGTLDITQLRAVLRTIGCERLCADVLQQLVELRHRLHELHTVSLGFQTFIDFQKRYYAFFLPQVMRRS